MRKVAPGVWLKKLFTARQRYCASLFPGAIRPALRLCMRALRARLPNVPNEITIYTYTTKTTKRLFFGHFVAFVETVAFVLFVGYHETVEIVAFVLFVGYHETVEIVDFVIPLGGREIVISLISLKSCFSGGTVKPLKSLISLGSLRLRDTLLGAQKKTGAFQHPSLGRSSGI